MIVASSACAPDPPSAVVRVTATGCGAELGSGSGALVDHGVVLTAAHTLRGADAITVSNGDGEADGTIVAFDPDLDLALVTADVAGHPLEIDSTGVAAGDHGRAWVVRRGEAVPIDAGVRRRVEIRSEDIYVEGETSRPGFELVAEIAPGDSGGALIVDGRLVGVLWARSRTSTGRAYAIDPDRGGGRIIEQRTSGDLGDVDLTRC